MGGHIEFDVPPGNYVIEVSFDYNVPPSTPIAQGTTVSGRATRQISLARGRTQIDCVYCPDLEERKALLQSVWESALDFLGLFDRDPKVNIELKISHEGSDPAQC
jgi:hypothetical protein